MNIVNIFLLSYILKHTYLLFLLLFKVKTKSEIFNLIYNCYYRITKIFFLLFYVLTVFIASILRLQVAATFKFTAYFYVQIYPIVKLLNR